MTHPSTADEPADPADPERVARHRRAKAQRALKQMLATIDGVHLTHYTNDEIIVILTLPAAEQLVEKLKKKSPER